MAGHDPSGRLQSGDVVLLYPDAAVFQGYECVCVLVVCSLDSALLCCRGPTGSPKPGVQSGYGDSRAGGGGGGGGGRAEPYRLATHESPTPQRMQSSPAPAQGSGMGHGPGMGSGMGPGPGAGMGQGQGPGQHASRRNLQVDFSSSGRTGRSPSVSPDRSSNPTSPYSVPHLAPMPTSKLCPVCTTTELTNPPDMPNYNTYTQCHSTVCNQCGFNPNPHLTEVRQCYCREREREKERESKREKDRERKREAERDEIKTERKRERERE